MKPEPGGMRWVTVRALAVYLADQRPDQLHAILVRPVNGRVVKSSVVERRPGVENDHGVHVQGSPYSSPRNRVCVFHACDPMRWGKAYRNSCGTTRRPTAVLPGATRAPRRQRDVQSACEPCKTWRSSPQPLDWETLRAELTLPPSSRIKRLASQRIRRVALAFAQGR